MIKRIIAVTTVFLLLLASAAGVTGVKSANTDKLPLVKEHPKLNKEQIQAKIGRAIKDARKNAIYDSAGRISKMTFDLPDLGKFTFEYKYDQQNRVQYIVDEKGRRTEYAYGESGELHSITFPNGTRMYELDKNGKGVFFKDGIKFTRCNAPQSRSVGIGNLRRIVMDDDFDDNCRAAVATAVAAVAAATVTCAAGDVAGCITQTALAAAAVYSAYVACKSNVVPVESAV